MGWRGQAGLTLLIAALGAAGCVSGGATSSLNEAPAPHPRDASDASAAVAQQDLLAMSRPPIDDLPVPIGFRIVEAASRLEQTATSRTVEHTYVGRDARQAVERFYRRTMPRHGWAFDAATVADGRHDLTFRKPGERCDVTLAREPSRSDLTRTRITITVQPD